MIAALKDLSGSGVNVSIVGRSDDCLAELEAVLNFFIQKYPVITVDLVNDLFEDYIQKEVKKFENEKDNKHNT